MKWCAGASRCSLCEAGAYWTGSGNVYKLAESASSLGGNAPDLTCSGISGQDALAEIRSSLASIASLITAATRHAILPLRLLSFAVHRMHHVSPLSET
jgi:hypothetical protein